MPQIITAGHGVDITKPYFNPRRAAEARRERIKIIIRLQELVEPADPADPDDYYWSTRNWMQKRLEDLNRILSEENAS